MHDKPKFGAVVKKVNSPIKVDVPDVPTFDLTTLTVQKLAENLKQVMDAKRPKFIWFKGRANKKAELDVQHQRLVLEQISNLRNINSELVNLQADLFLSSDMLEAIIADRYQDIKRKMAIFAEQHKNEMHRIGSEIKVRDLTIEKMELENLEKQADINLKNAQTEEAKAKAYFIRYVLQSINISRMPETLQTYIISSIFNPNGTQFNDFDMQEQIKQYVIQQTEASANKAREEVKQMESDTGIKRLRLKREENKPL